MNPKSNIQRKLMLTVNSIILLSSTVKRVFSLRNKFCVLCGATELVKLYCFMWAKANMTHDKMRLSFLFT